MSSGGDTLGDTRGEFRGGSTAALILEIISARRADPKDDIISALAQTREPASGRVSRRARHDVAMAPGSAGPAQLPLTAGVRFAPGHRVRGTRRIMGCVNSNLRTVADAFATLWGTPWDALNLDPDKQRIFNGLKAAVVLTLPSDAGP